MHARKPYLLFEYHWLQKFVSACQKIESDPNYQLDITDENLLSLVKGDDSSKKAIVLYRSAIDALTIEGDRFGMVYQLKIAAKTWADDADSNYNYQEWSIDDSAIILVNKKGEFSLHDRKKAENGNFNSPLTNVHINQFLNQKCLHPSNDDKPNPKIAQA